MDIFFHIQRLLARKERSERPSRFRPLPKAHLCVISDLHYITNKEFQLIEIEAVKPCDALLLLGDIGPDDAGQIVSYFPETVPCFYVLGNHDRWNQYDDIERLRTLDGAIYTLPNGLTIGGCSGSLRYKDDRSRAMRTEWEMSNFLMDFPRVDIFISHESAYHMIGTNSTHGGFKAITEYIEDNDPAIHLFGHQHDVFEEKLDDTLCVCVFRCLTVDTRPLAINHIF